MYNKAAAPEMISGAAALFDPGKKRRSEVVSADRSASIEPLKK
jgi:hypothetical protein